MNTKDRNWRKVVSGIYVSRDRKFKIQRSYDQNLRPNGWQLLQDDGNNGWDWCNTYVTFGDAKNAAKEL